MEDTAIDIVANAGTGLSANPPETVVDAQVAATSSRQIPQKSAKSISMRGTRSWRRRRNLKIFCSALIFHPNRFRRRPLPHTFPHTSGEISRHDAARPATALRPTSAVQRVCQRRRKRSLVEAADQRDRQVYLGRSAARSEALMRLQRSWSPSCFFIRSVIDSYHAGGQPRTAAASWPGREASRRSRAVEFRKAVAAYRW